MVNYKGVSGASDIVESQGKVISQSAIEGRTSSSVPQPTVLAVEGSHFSIFGLCIQYL